MMDNEQQPEKIIIQQYRDLFERSNRYFAGLRYFLQLTNNDNFLAFLQKILTKYKIQKHNKK